MLGIRTIQLETRYAITRMTNEDVIKLFPKSADAIKVAEQMKIVKSAET